MSANGATTVAARLGGRMDLRRDSRRCSWRKFVSITMRGLFAAICLDGKPAASAATPPANDIVIELPPMIVAESSKAPPWLYVDAGNTEYLSRCSASTTRAFVVAQQESYQLLRVLVPDAFLAKMDTPVASILAPIALKQAGDDAVIQEMMRMEEESTRRAADKASRELRVPPSARRVQFLPNMRLDDRDMTAVFSYVDERAFDSERLIAADDYVHYLLLRRTPTLPSWLIEGIVAVYQQADLRGKPITLRPLLWISREESVGLQRDPEARRTLLPANELFAPDALLDEANRHEQRVAAWRSQVALFFRWALDPLHAPARDALWKFAARASEQPVTEAWFTECFGFGFSDLAGSRSGDLRDRLSDYLPDRKTQTRNIP